MLIENRIKFIDFVSISLLSYPIISHRPVQWNSPKNTAKPGANWTPQPMAATTGAGYRPMVSYASTNSTLYSTELLLQLLLMYYNNNY